MLSAEESIVPPAIPQSGLRRAAGRYLLAVAVTIATTAVQWLLNTAFGRLPPFVLFYPSVLLSATLAGGGPGALAVVLSALAADFLFIEPVGYFAAKSTVDFISLGLFTATSMSVSVLVNRLHRARRLAAMARQQAFLAVTLASIGEAVVATDTAGKVTFINPAAALILGRSQAEVRDQPLSSVFNVIDAANRGPVEDLITTILRSPSATGTIRDLILVSNQNREITVELRGAPVRADHGGVSGVVLTFRDITERARIQDELRSLNSALEETVVHRTAELEEREQMTEELRGSYARIRDLASRLETVREDERRTVATTLHDGIAQDLFAIGLGLTHLEKQANKRVGVTNVCKELNLALAKCMDDTRQVANDLRPAGLADRRICAVLAEHARYFGERSHLAIRVTETEAFPSLGESTQLLLFRAAQEALTNVARHAQATAVDIVLGTDQQQIIMDISDDGIGVCASNMHKPRSLGLLGLRERFAALGGGLTVQRRQPKGTRVTAYLPAPAAGPAPAA
jgi:PAS domain S-box-containing protein